MTPLEARARELAAYYVVDGGTRNQCAADILQVILPAAAAAMVEELNSLRALKASGDV